MLREPVVFSLQCLTAIGKRIRCEMSLLSAPVKAYSASRTKEASDLARAAPSKSDVAD